MANTGPFDANNVYALGNAWSQLGDTINSELSAMDSAIAGVSWSGDGGTQFEAAWQSVRAAVAALPEMCWNIGEEINYYGQQAQSIEAQARKA